MGKSYKIKSTGGQKITFKVPDSIRHEEAANVIIKIIQELSEERPLTYADIPQLHRLLTAYDSYLSCVDVISEQGLTMQNIKDETVKRPEANLLRENWAQYLDIAKEYGLTPRSRKMTKGATDTSGGSDADEFFNSRR